MEALNQPRTELQEMALSAATSVASAAGRAFGPYMPQLLPMMQRCMQVSLYTSRGPLCAVHAAAAAHDAALHAGKSLRIFTTADQ
jgi:hypothetical protein